MLKFARRRGRHSSPSLTIRSPVSDFRFTTKKHLEMPLKKPFIGCRQIYQGLRIAGLSPEFVRVTDRPGPAATLVREMHQESDRLMPTYIDESGDPGTRVGSTAYFRLDAVFFESSQHHESFSECLLALRSELRLPRDFEFHFAKIGHGLRTNFFQAVAPMPFSFVVSAFDKLGSARPRLDKKAIHAETVKGMIPHLED